MNQEASAVCYASASGSSLLQTRFGYCFYERQGSASPALGLFMGWALNALPIE
ncbi:MULTISPECIES: hypothetical protein [Microcoleaceae]|uniref:hypothetical protein n=1 Tax=Microcoleaceae TaxID=1892252 RepID=UPI00187FFC21|nr:hypothetical protein [Tychonema sp. LEGE 06208]MBE9161512.1 hypothetical protein [Tychonema sp. LEGE 06208]